MIPFKLLEVIYETVMHVVDGGSLLYKIHWVKLTLVQEISNIL